MAWTDEMIQNVWDKGKVTAGNDKEKWRKDECGAWISRMEYGNRNSQCGWEIDHISPGELCLSVDLATCDKLKEVSF